MHDHRGSAEETYVEAANRVQRPRKCLIFRQDADRRDDGTDQNTDEHADYRDQKRILKSLHNFDVTVFLNKYLYKLVPFVPEVSHNTSR